MLDRVARPLNWLAIGLLTFCIVGASFNAFYTKWGLREADHRFGIDAIIQGTAHKPFAYRRMLPDLAFTINDALPRPVERLLGSVLIRPDKNGQESSREQHVTSSRHSIYYHLIKYAVFLFTFFAFAAFYLLCRSGGATPPVAYVASAAAILISPLTQTEGAYYYDMAENCCLSLFVLCAIDRRWLYLPLVAAIGAWNKESLLFFVPCTYPLLRSRLETWRALALLGLCMLIAAAIYEVQRLRFAGNPGSTTEFHLWEQIEFFVSPSRFLKPESIYSVFSPPAIALLVLLATAGVFVRAWGGLPRDIRQSILIALAINGPLFLLFCAPGELRNLSMLLPGAVLSLAVCCQQAFDRAHGGVPQRLGS